MAYAIAGRQRAPVLSTTPGNDFEPACQRRGLSLADQVIDGSVCEVEPASSGHPPWAGFVKQLPGIRQLRKVVERGQTNFSRPAENMAIVGYCVG